MAQDRLSRRLDGKFFRLKPLKCAGLWKTARVQDAESLCRLLGAPPPRARALRAPRLRFVRSPPGIPVLAALRLR